MQYCNECNSVEQGTIKKVYPDYTEKDFRELAQKELTRLAKYGVFKTLTSDEELEWGKDLGSYEICAVCESEDETIVNIDEDAGKD